MNKHDRAKHLIQLCNKSLADNEYNVRSVRGVACSHSDVETILLYAETIRDNGFYTGILMKPRCEVEAVLATYDLVENHEHF